MHAPPQSLRARDLASRCFGRNRSSTRWVKCCLQLEHARLRATLSRSSPVSSRPAPDMHKSGASKRQLFLPHAELGHNCKPASASSSMRASLVLKLCGAFAALIRRNRSTTAAQASAEFCSASSQPRQVLTQSCSSRRRTCAADPMASTSTRAAKGGTCMGADPAKFWLLFFLLFFLLWWWLPLLLSLPLLFALLLRLLLIILLVVVLADYTS